MKFLCVSDHRDPLIYTNSIKQRFKDISFVLGAGDVELPYYGFIVSSLNKPLAFVFGNHNLGEFKNYRKEYNDSGECIGTSCIPRKSYGSIYIGGKVKTINGIIIAGLGGSMKYNNGQNQYTELGMFFFMLRLFPKLLFNRIFKGRFLDILLTHAPPFGIHDKPNDRCHRGFKVFLWFMRKFKPKYLIHGHIHLYDMNAKRVSYYKNTTIVNCYGHVLLEIEDKHAHC
jgi:uncharacterized protein